MKRSEMVKNLTDWCYGFSHPTLSREQVARCAESILSKIEESGMLPPNVCWLATGEYSPVKQLTELASSD